jgi:hypothetical protein
MSLNHLKMFLFRFLLEIFLLLYNLNTRDIINSYEFSSKAYVVLFISALKEIKVKL